MHTWPNDFVDNVILGNCLEVMQAIPNGSVDMVLCDLPYKLTSNKWDIPIPLDKLWMHYKRIIKKNGIVALTGSQPFTSLLITSNMEMFKHEWIWQKNRGSNFANTCREPMKEHESVLIFSNGKWTYNKQMQERTGSGLARVQYDLNWTSQSSNYREFDGRYGQHRPDLRVPSSVQKFNIEVGLHPTQKPIALFEYLIRTYSNQGDVVLDNCIGSGTTAVACLHTGRHFIGIEKEEKYYRVAMNRIEDEYSVAAQD